MACFGLMALLAGCEPCARAPGAERAAFLTGFTDLRAGDLIFRRGRSLESHAVLLADESSRYSHVGIVVLRGETPLVVHTVPATEDDPGGARADPLQAFLSTENATAAAVFRLKDDPSSAAAEAARKASTFAENAVPFDSAFDLAEQERLYCAELVWAAYTSAGLDLVGNNLARLTFPLVSAEWFILPSTLQSSPIVELIDQIEEPLKRGSLK